MTANRLERICTLMQDYKIRTLAINAGHDLNYLTGLDFHLSERPAILIITDKGRAAFIFPEFEKEKVAHSEIPLDAFPYPEDVQTWPGIARAALEHLDLTGVSIAVSPTAMRYLEIELLQKASGEIRIVSGADIFRDLYIQKDAEEINAIRKAIQIAQDALLATLPQIKPGKKEVEIANLLVINLLNKGSQPDLPFNPIIASGPNSANPHAMPGERELQPGDMLIIDWGARYNGYISDITRSFAIGKIPEPFEKIHAVVLSANQTARNQVGDGKSAPEIDSAAREVIAQAGYGDYFTHRTGHGIGLEAHEDPYISSSSPTILSKGMVFTIEPGIYLPGKGGIRIEDNIVVTEEGCETLTSLPRELQVL